MTLKNIYKQQAIPLMVLAALSIAVWTIGPFLTIAHAAPLASPEKRLYIIAAFFLAWLLKCIFFDEAPLKKNAIPCPPEILKRLQALHGRFQGALNFLKKPMVSKKLLIATLLQKYVALIIIRAWQIIFTLYSFH